MTKETQSDISQDELESRAENLARRYLDLWQDEMSALAAEPLPGAAGQKIIDSCVDLSQAGLAWTGALVGMTRQASQQGSPDAAQAFVAQGLALSGQWQEMLQKNWATDGPPAASDQARQTTAGDGDIDRKEPVDEEAQKKPEQQSKKGNLNHDTTGTPSSTAASERGSRDLDELARRLALLEERLAAYEAGPEEESGGAGS